VLSCYKNLHLLSKKNPNAPTPTLPCLMLSSPLLIHNSLSRKKEEFHPLKPPFVGLYVCGPTVYGPPHLGHARSAITFDIVYRYLKKLGYRVRYVRNITDVGHLENDSDEGEDKILKRAKVEQLEPMEIVQLYMNKYHGEMDKLNILRPGIEPRATGHIPEQIKLIEKILSQGFAYCVNGSVYFDVIKYSQHHPYGILSGRKLDELLSGDEERELEGQKEKRNPVDFALWKKANPEHIMRWDSPWGEGFPGWHLECSVMSTKYLGLPFDIHGGGMDLLFPHHECEISQSQAGSDTAPVKYWMHNNMITINGQKMGKSLGNAIGLEEFFSGKHPLLERSYPPMTIRFFILQAHYRSTLDFSNAALIASEKGLKKLLQAKKLIVQINPSQKSTRDIKKWLDECYLVMNDDFNTAQLIACLFSAASWIYSSAENKETFTSADLILLKNSFELFFTEILGLKEETEPTNDKYLDGLMSLIIELRNNARKNKDYATSDAIREKMKELSIQLEDGKEGTRWVL